MPLIDNLVAFWELEEASGTRNDSHGANHLSDNGTVTSTTGKVGTAAQFTASSSQYLSITDNAALSMGDIDCTLVAWVYLDDNSVNHVIIGKGTGGTDDEYLLQFVTSGVNRFYWSVSTDGIGIFDGELAASTFGLPATGAWHFVVATHDSVGNTLNISVNDGTVDSVGYSGGIFNGGSDFALGAYSALTYMDGRLDQVGIWKRILTPTEITWLYNSGNGRSYAEVASNGAIAIASMKLAFVRGRRPSKRRRAS